MSAFRLIIASLLHHRRMNVAVALGVAAATAVLTGALLVGDSMRGSLQHLTLDRLGRVDEVLVVPRFFRAQLAADVAADRAFQKDFAAAVPAIMIEGTLANPDPKDPAQASHVSLFGSDAEFWKLGDGGPKTPPGRDEIVLNEPLAEKLRAKVGSDVIVRIGQANEIPADSPLGRKTATVRSRRVKVSAIIPAEGLGRFGIRPTQQTPRNAYLALAMLQQMLEQLGKVNAILVAGKNSADAPPADRLNTLLRPTLADMSLAIRQTPRRYFNLTSDRMLLEEPVEAAAATAFAGAEMQPALTYLANYIQAGPQGEAKIPYSTITALDLTTKPPLGPFVDVDGQTIEQIGDDQIVLNQWAADDLAAQGVTVRPGDPITLTFFEPESTHGQVHERTVTLRLKAIVPMTGPAADPDFTPELQGVTDKKSIANWDPPFPYDPARVRSTPPKDQDDRYWQQYKAMPKGFVSLATGRRLWSSRFGQTTSLRIPPTAAASAEELASRLERQLDPATLGFEFLAVKRLGLTASAGTTPFGLLFLGFSMFIIAAAAMLVALLFRLSIEQQADEIGLLMAVGLRARTVRRLLLSEGLLVAVVGAAIGVIAGVGYAWLMLAGLRTWWLAAVTTPFLQLYVTPQSLAIGFVSGLIVVAATIVSALRAMRRPSVRQLLAGQMGGSGQSVRHRTQVVRWVAAALVLGAIVLGGFAMSLGGEAQAGAFFGAGSFILAAALLSIWAQLRSGSGLPLVVGDGSPLVRLAARNAGRNPSRSTLTIGLIAAASFLIVAISAFRLSPPSDTSQRDAGNGGFSLVAQSDQPIYQDLNTAAGRNDAALSADQSAQLNDARITALRVQSGEDASCLNLYQPRQPRVLGVPPQLIERGGFEWSQSAADLPQEEKNPWRLLDKPLGSAGDGRDIVPVALDENTALYSLHLADFTSSPIGKRFDIDDGFGGKLHLQVVGLLKNSIFQGDVLMAERALVAHFPNVNGYRFFLVEAAPDKVAAVRGALEGGLTEYGFDVEPTAARLATFFAVQNTYLSTFQSLGGLGLLLGTFGLATVQLRNVLERRGELALLRAVGFQRRRLARLVMIENALLLVGGLAVGIVAALVAIAPHLLAGGATIPWSSLAATLLTVLVVGMLAGLLAVWATLRAPLIAALRGE